MRYSVTTPFVSAAFVMTAIVLALPSTAAAHCQVPCGIYDDHARVHGMLEDVTTIAKAVGEIGALAKKSDAQSLNQATRWIMTKEQHATRIITTVSEYFLTQKIKPADPKDRRAWTKYVQLLTDHHRVMKLAMKAKQTVDGAVVAELRTAVKALEAHWPKPKK